MQHVQSGEKAPPGLRAAFSSQVSPPLKTNTKDGKPFFIAGPRLRHFAEYVVLQKLTAFRSNT